MNMPTHAIFSCNAHWRQLQKFIAHEFIAAIHMFGSYEYRWEHVGNERQCIAYAGEGWETSGVCPLSVELARQMACSASVTTGASGLELAVFHTPRQVATFSSGSRVLRNSFAGKSQSGYPIAIPMATFLDSGIPTTLLITSG